MSLEATNTQGNRKYPYSKIALYSMVTTLTAFVAVSAAPIVAAAAGAAAVGGAAGGGATIAGLSAGGLVAALGLHERADADDRARTLARCSASRLWCSVLNHLW